MTAPREPRTFLDGIVTLYADDCRTILREIADNSVDSVVTDPPYHLTSIVKRFGGKNAAPGKNPQKADGSDGPFKRVSSGFMGKQWDGGDIAFRPELWAEVLRVLKPGGYIMAFSGCRTYHRMACAIEDAGFDVRDQLVYCFGSGFPKSRNVSRDLNGNRCLCNMRDKVDVPTAVAAPKLSILQPSVPLHRDAQDADLRSVRSKLDTEGLQARRSREDMFARMPLDPNLSPEDRSDEGRKNKLCDLRETDLSRSVSSQEKHGSLLQSVVSGESARGPFNSVCSEREGEASPREGYERTVEPGVERGSDVPTSPRQLREREICSMPARVPINGEGGRLCNGASFGNGAMDRAPVDTDGMCPPRGSQPIAQCEDEFSVVAGQSQSQERGAWPLCDRCGKPIIPNGLGTALKPAHETICMARKPFERGLNGAQNVQKWGVGAINVGACKIPTESQADIDDRRRVVGFNKSYSNGEPSISLQGGADGSLHKRDRSEFDPTHGRWPANLIHDGSDEVLACFPDSGSHDANGVWRNGVDGACFGHYGKTEKPESGRGDSGSAARFFASFPQEDVQRIFYTSKAGADDRLGSKHPTVKPIDLIQYLVRLVTPPKGVCLDLFAGTGTTAEACFREGFRAILIENDPESIADIERRMSLVMEGPVMRANAGMKARGRPRDDGPLFGGTDGDLPIYKGGANTSFEQKDHKAEWLRRQRESADLTNAKIELAKPEGEATE